MNTLNSIKLLLLAASTIDGFNAGRRLLHPRVSTRTVGTKYRPSPLFYTDIEPEIRSITVPPPVIHFNETYIIVESTESGQCADDGSEEEMRIANQSKVSKEALLSPTHNEATEKKEPKAYKPHRAVWQTRYNELIEYKAANGHCQVPQNYNVNRKLGLWVMQQRRQYTLQKTGKRSSFNGSEGKKRIQLLEDIGFTWRVDRRGPRGAYGSLRMMKEHADVAIKGGTGNEILDATDFEQYLIEKSAEYSDREIRDAWRQRFELFK